MEVYTKSDVKEFKGCSFATETLIEDFEQLATNFKTTSLAFKIGPHSMGGMVNETDYLNSPLCSPFNLFCLYPKQRLKSLKNQWLKRLINGSTKLFELWFRRAKFNQLVQVNNKPCDSIIHPQLTQEEVVRCVKKLTNQFPDYGILFPRIDPVTSPLLFKNLENEGFYMVPTRMVNLFLPEHNYQKKSYSKRDRSLLKKSAYSLVEHNEIKEEDLKRIHELYQLLFIDKHSDNNPNLTLKFFRDALKNKWYTFFALRSPEGVIDAFFCYETSEKIMACGPLGYDTTKPQELGLYRMLFARSLEIAKENHYTFNFGGGNDRFKMNRGGIREVGYTAAYIKHLPFYRRLPWWFLTFVGKKITVKFLKKTEF